ncbi:hypothetical protein PENSTE_c017G05391 [Penicillium steckii]|uniref:F-box domain-containing protein n=1 Tax=Penicillium steckii TaxID=303698 RepID=A0A1V6SXI2_9EURO|nr:hypothetical protein PENSTE_c017G05391 [Penicillium steckii]
MSSNDYYCALCGSTFSNYHIAEKPHSAGLRQAFRSSQAKKQALNPARDEGEGSVQESPTREVEDDVPVENDEMYTYDPSIISREDAKWVYDLQCLGINTATEVPMKGFVSNISHQSTYGMIEVHDHDDEDIFASDYFSAYHDTTNSGKKVYPFHPNCWDLFKIAFEYYSTGEKPVSAVYWFPSLEAASNLDKALLFDVMSRHGNNQLRRLSGIDYGEPDPPNQARWVARPGEELFLADPTRAREPNKAMIAEKWSSMPSINCRPSTYPPQEIQKIDPFSRLPYELLSMILSELEASSLIGLFSASPHVHRVVSDIPLFWLEAMRSSMPWFFEMQEFLDTFSKDRTIKSGADLDLNRLRLLCLWANHITTPRVGMTGTFMGIANRRRIWGICRQLIDKYTSIISVRRL